MARCAMPPPLPISATDIAKNAKRKSRRPPRVAARDRDRGVQRLEHTGRAREGRAIRKPHYPTVRPEPQQRSSCWGGARRHPPASGVANPPGPIFWSGPTRDLTAALPTRPREGDVCEDVLEPRGGLNLHAQGCKRGLLRRT
eukprot:scaffold17467_cov65-Phaeocystis_antarctica.AAC.3